MAPYKIIKQGYMLKEPPPSKRGLRKKLHRYWFVLVEDKHQVALVYFKNEDSYIARQRNEGFLKVDDSQSINVIGEYLGSKNAFSIITPKQSYTLVTESRYDLHEWLFTLHNALEAFQKRQLRAKARETQRQRASSTSSSSHGTTSTGGTPQLTPMRRAPPPPPGTNNKPPRRPSRPAPPAPGVQRQSREEGATAIVDTNLPIGREGESPPPAYTSDNSTPLSSQEPVATVVNLTGLESARHPVMDLDLSQTEEAPPPPAHIRVASDSLIMMHETSQSMPDITAKHGDSSSPDEESQEGHSKPKPLALTCMDSPSTRHTRHLSLTIGPDGTKPTRKKRSTKGSLKLRSRSPPNSPPPPPPPESAPTDSSSQDLPAQDPLSQTSPVLTSQASNASLGFSDVMNTISNIDQQLDRMAGSPPMAPHPQHSPSPTDDHHMTSKQSPSPVMAYQEEEEDFLIPAPQIDEAGQLVTAEDLERVTATETAITKHIPPPREFDNRDSVEPVDRELTPPKAPEEPTTASGEGTHQQEADKPLQNRDLQLKPAKSSGKNHRVMFKEEVEDIPPLYDPAHDPSLDTHRDQYEPRVDKEIPSTVAELKKMLFGDKSTAEVTKYSKEGSLSPRYTHPLNASFSADYEYTQETPLSPSTTKEDIGPKPRAVSDKEGGGEDEEDGPYDTPWDQKPVSKYSVIGVRRRSRDSLTSPIGERVQFGEVSTHEAPTPGNTELRNVHSLERPPKYAHPKRDGKHSLLESISNTLQVQSKYGSDSLLNGTSTPPQQANGSPQQLISPQQVNGSAREPKNSPYNSPLQGRKAPRSTRGELEKIKAEHRREVQSSPQKVVPAPKPVRQAGFSPKPALSASWDGNLRSTQVMYDANTQAHILRSLV